MNLHLRKYWKKKRMIWRLEKSIKKTFKFFYHFATTENIREEPMATAWYYMELNFEFEASAIRRLKKL